MVVLALLGGLVLGAFGVYLALRPQLIERRRRIDEVLVLERELAAAQTELSVERRALDERLAATITSLSTQALDANSSRFLELAEARISGQVRPLKDSLDRMDNQLQSVERVRHEAYGALRAQVTTLSERAGSLTNALRTPHIRGRWGEITLRRTAELAGMASYCDFYEQETMESDNGRLRPA